MRLETVSMSTVYKSKIDWWIPALVAVTMAMSFVGPIIDGELFIVGVIVAGLLCSFEIVMFASVRYRIDGERLGVRNLLYRWEWFPIDKISEVKKTHGLLSAPALSTRRVSIRFSDKRILKSSMPLEISPKDRDGFISRLKEINPKIRYR